MTENNKGQAKPRTATDSLSILHGQAKRLVEVLDGIRHELRDKSLLVPPAELGIALGYILSSGYKTFRALCKVCDVGEPWGQQGLVFSRMLFENYVTARWLAARPSERANLFIEFSHIAEVQSALIKGEIDNSFLAEGGAVPEGKSELHRQFFRVLPLFRKLKPGQGITKEQVLRQKWTDRFLPTMITDLDKKS